MKYINNEVAGYTLGDLPEGPIAELAQVAYEAAAEGQVLLENSRGTLPLTAGDKVAVFGRGQFEYCKSGTGSGGAVKVTYVTNILETLRANAELTIDETVSDAYRAFIAEHPFDNGHGWATEPWCQVEMPLEESLVEQAVANGDNKAVIIICRTAGEDKDNSATAGSWYLTEEEEHTIALVTKHFKNVAVVLNVGNIIDMAWVKKYDVDAVLYAWQGGMEGGRATADVMMGKICPSGKLSNTIALIEDYPAHANFGSPTRNIYAEDIYVGYRYFETFAQDKVTYPFGYGLSYTTFAVKTEKVEMELCDDGTIVTISAQVTNTGTVAGKEIVQVYLSAPQGKLGKAERELVAFVKTKTLAPGESEIVETSFALEDFAAYDDSGATGHKSAYVLEAGQYLIYVGTDIRSAEAEAAYALEERVVRQCTEALSPVTPFDRMRPDADGQLTYEPAPLRTYDLEARIRDNRPAEITPTGDHGIKLVDVRDGKATMEEFIAQLSDEDLVNLTRGEGMNSPKVTPGTGSCFGGVTDSLIGFGVPIACTTDGPSGLRMDSGLYATSLPNGTLLACSWNLPLVYRLFVLEGVEMTAYKIEALLGPGINIHRHPLNGRNFEYFSEDPLLTGRMAAAMCAAVKESDVSCTIKHMMANNQEWHRHETDSVMSERAAREIYLRPFEIAILQGGADCIMTSYNLVNGIHAASNYDLNTTILRGEWGYQGFVMTDWWARMNKTENDPSDMKFQSLMIRAQNDVYMVCADAATHDDDAMAALADGTLARSEVQRCAMTICSYLMKTHAMERFLANGSTYQSVAQMDISTMTLVATTSAQDRWVEKDVEITEAGKYAAVITYHADAAPHVQIPVSLIYGSHRVGFVMVTGTNGEQASIQVSLDLDKSAKFKFISTNAAIHFDETKFYI